MPKYNIERSLFDEEESDGEAELKHPHTPKPPPRSLFVDDEDECTDEDNGEDHGLTLADVTELLNMERQRRMELENIVTAANMRISSLQKEVSTLRRIAKQKRARRRTTRKPAVKP